MSEQQLKMVRVEPELKWLNEEKRLPCREWVNWFRDKNSCSLRHAVDVGLARLRAAPSTAAPQPPAQDEPHPVGDTHFEVSPNSVVRAAFAQGYETGRAHGKAEQPPALGGEPEVLGWRVESHNGTCLTNYVQRPDWAYQEDPKIYSITELVDRSNVARLQAEVERLTARNAELVKAGKNLLRVLGMANSGSSAYNKAVMEFDAALAGGKEHE